MMVKTDVKCPKCKSNNISFIELWKDAAIYWDVEDGEFERNEGSLEPGNPYRLDAKCKICKHIWKIKKAIQIDDIIN